MGIVAVAGMPEIGINLNFVLFLFSLLWVAIIICITFVNLQYYDSFPLTLSPGRALNF